MFNFGIDKVSPKNNIIFFQSHSLVFEKDLEKGRLISIDTKLFEKFCKNFYFKNMEI